MDLLVVLVVALVMAIGLLGTVLPFVPGLPLIWGAALVYGLATDFGAVGWTVFSFMTVLLIGGMVAGIVLPHRRLSTRGAPASTVAAGILLGIVGFFVIPIVGLPVGAVAGVLAAERLRTSDWSVAWATTRDLIIGFGIGALVELSAGLVMVVLWVIWLAFG